MRRRYLLSVLNMEMYRKQLFEYVFHNVIPDTIQDRNARNQGKLKLGTIFGNGEIENQLVENGDFSDGTNGWTTFNSTLSVSDKVLTATKNGSNIFGVQTNINISFYDTHKYLILREV